ncbi:hypothetical protein [Hymenobacter volaticus]|uniref:Uncharacterized protein n=1 Tax=Hymenobacter volaticus TaxID=2932254 RepID=A0ABY4G8X3_9BACT|nr:hypothetical protein [Hymenobacter volaticus]UOQ67333.1 hypothetical protein MUN86_05475 [Hymenobacter volaticus]
MKIYYLLLLLLPFASYAQGPVYQVDLQEQKLSLPNATFHISEVLDLRVNTNTIGWVQRGLYNVRVPANLKGGATNCLTQWLQSQMPAQPGSRPVIMRIHDLRIGEIIKATSEKAKAIVDVDFLVLQPDGRYYILLRHPDEEIHGGIETTSFHDDNIAACLQRGVTLLNTLSWDQRLSNAPSVTAEQIRYRTDRAPEVYTYPILTATVPTRGLYSSFLDFRRNQPDTATAFEVEKQPRTNAEWQNTEEIKLYNGSGATRVELAKVWGFSDGQQLYIRHRNRYYPLQRAGNDFTFEGHAGADAGAVSTASFIGGAAGGIIAAAATTGHRQEYTLDIATGRVSDFDYMAQFARRDTAMVIVYRRPGSVKKPMTILLDGKKLGDLPANNFLQIPWTNKTKEVTLCIEGLESSYSFIPNFTTVNYVELRAKSDADKPVLEAAPTKEGVFYTKKMRRL